MSARPDHERALPEFPYHPDPVATGSVKRMFHCEDGAAFLGLVGRPELEGYPDALEVLRREHDKYGWAEEEVDEYLAALDKDDMPTAYLFACRHRGAHLAYSDFT